LSPDCSSDCSSSSSCFSPITVYLVCSTSATTKDSLYIVALLAISIFSFPSKFSSTVPSITNVVSFPATSEVSIAKIL